MSEDQETTPNQSQQPLRPAIEAALSDPLPDREARIAMAQTIADYASGCDITPVLSDRLTAQYMYDHMGGLDGNDGLSIQTFQHVEAYNVVFADDAADFAVDRRSIYNPNESKESYAAKQDATLINQALQDWFKTNVFMKQRVPNSDTAVVDQLVASHINIRFGIGACLKYGILHHCFEVPHSLHSGAGDSNKKMYIEMYATLVNVRPQFRGGFPYVHLWEHEELRFRMRHITYSDRKYLTVHMPGYG